MVDRLIGNVRYREGREKEKDEAMAERVRWCLANTTRLSRRAIPGGLDIEGGETGKFDAFGDIGLWPMRSHRLRHSRG